MGIWAWSHASALLPQQTSAITNAWESTPNPLKGKTDQGVCVCVRVKMKMKMKVKAHTQLLQESCTCEQQPVETRLCLQPQDVICKNMFCRNRPWESFKQPWQVVEDTEGQRWCSVLTTSGRNVRSSGKYRYIFTSHGNNDLFHEVLLLNFFFHKKKRKSYLERPLWFHSSGQSLKIRSLQREAPSSQLCCVSLDSIKKHIHK